MFEVLRQDIRTKLLQIGNDEAVVVSDRVPMNDFVRAFIGHQIIKVDQEHPCEIMATLSGFSFSKFFFPLADELFLPFLYHFLFLIKSLILHIIT